MSNKSIIRRIVALVVIMFGFTVAIQARTAAERMGWKLSIQSYTFHKFTLLEALDKTSELGLKYIEVYPGHRLGGQWGDKEFGPSLDAATRKAVLAEAKKRGVRIVGCGVYVTESREDWDRFFAFAREMKLDYVTCEPPTNQWNLIDQLSKKYGIRVAVHNHPQPSSYWNPDLLLSAIGERGKGRMGSCADVGHWNRENLDHLACLRKLGDRIMTFHFKDIEGPRADGAFREDVIWGQGVLRVDEMLKTIRDLKFKGYLAIEYENNWLNSVPDIRRCIAYMESLCEKMK